MAVVNFSWRVTRRLVVTITEVSILRRGTSQTANSLGRNHHWPYFSPCREPWKLVKPQVWSLYCLLALAELTRKTVGHSRFEIIAHELSGQESGHFLWKRFAFFLNCRLFVHVHLLNRYQLPYCQYFVGSFSFCVLSFVTWVHVNPTSRSEHQTDDLKLVKDDKSRFFFFSSQTWSTLSR